MSEEIRMNHNTLIRKVKVFISSKCNETYNIVRNALRALLEETGLIETYVFEDEPASSKQLEDAYLDELDTSHLVIFIIRNIDGVPNAVLKEHQRARSLNIRSLYLFCDEKSGEVTDLQNELIQNKVVKFQVVHDFCEIAKKAYVAALADITSIYRANNVSITPIEKALPKNDESQGGVSERNESGQGNYTSSGLLIRDLKNISNMYPRTLSVVERFLMETDELSESSCPLDHELANFLLRVLGQIGEIQQSTFDTIIKELPTVCYPEFLPLILNRWQAIISYFNSDVTECKTQINRIWDSIKDDSKISSWVLADVLIDLRNQSIVVDNHNNTISFEGAQEYLDALTFPAYYPVLDRLSENVYEEVLEDIISEQLKSPYVIKLGSSNNQLCDFITSSFIIAALHGSLTHIRLVTDKLEKVLLGQCLTHLQHRAYINLLALYVHSSSYDDFDKAVRQLQPTDVFNADDALALWNFANNVILDSNRFKARLFVWDKMCDYFSEEKFLDISSELLASIEFWIEDPKKVVSSGKVVFEALAKIASRGDCTKILQVLCKAIDHKILRYADEIHKAAKKIDYTKVEDEVVNLLLSRLFEQSISENRQNYHYLPELLLSIRKRKPKFSKQIDEVVKQSFLNYYSTTYELEISSSIKIYSKHIKRYIELSKQRNAEQGKGGRYSGYSNDVNTIIQSIILHQPKVLTKQLKYDILSTAKDTILAETQTVSAKINAIHLIETLWSLSNEDDHVLIKSEMSQVVSERQSFGVINDFFSDITETPFLISKGFLQLLIGYGNIEQLIEKILFFDRQNKREILIILEEFEAILGYETLQEYFEQLHSTIIQFAFEMTNSKEIEIQKAATLILVRAIRTRYKEMSIHRLSTLMDSGASSLKLTILYGINRYFHKKYGAFKYIIQKSLVDNNYQVRRFAEILEHK